MQRSLAIQEKVLGTEHPLVATSLNNLAELYQAQGNYNQAEPLYQRSLAIFEQVLGKEHPDVATSLNNLAALYQAQGNYSQAEPLLQRSLAIYEQVLGKEHPLVALSLHNLAFLYRNMGNYSQAEPLLQRALAIREQVLGKEHPLVATSLSNLAALYWVQNDITRTLEFIIRATNIEERNLAVIFTTGSEARKRAYMATLSGSTDVNISLHIQDAPNNPEAARLALTTTLQRKGRILDALTDSLQTLRQNLKPEDQILLNQLATTRSQLATLIFNKPEDIPLEQYQQQVATLKAQAEQLENTLSRRSAEFRTETQPVTIEAVQQLIPTDAALVELVQYQPFNAKATKQSERFGTPRYVAYILHSTGDIQWIDLGEAQAINQAVEDFRNALQSQSSTIKPVARTLDELLTQPIRQKLGNTRTILLSPDSQLNLIPFAALVDENNRYLVENYSINYLSSGRDLLRLQNHTPSQSAPIILANPDYNQPGDPSVNIASNRGTSPPAPLLQGEGSKTNIPPLLRGARGDRNGLHQNSRGLLDDAIKTFNFPLLPGTASEAQAISQMLPSVTLFTGSQATENVLKQLHRPNILHIATHGFFREDLPQVAPPDYSNINLLQGTRSAQPNLRTPTENPLLRSGLALAGANLQQSGNEDGILTALEAAGLNLYGTKLVVLSACKTGVGDIKNGEGVYGLRRALALAGSESQVISLWVVNDNSTNRLMVNYYKRLMNNTGRSDALRQTQLEMLQSEIYQHPYYWAAFIPSGDWTAMEF